MVNIIPIGQLRGQDLYSREYFNINDMPHDNYLENSEGVLSFLDSGISKLSESKISRKNPKLSETIKKIIIKKRRL